MKKLISVLAVAAICFSLCACGNTNTIQGNITTTESVTRDKEAYYIKGNISVKAPDNYNTYDKDLTFTEEMCQSQGETYDRMKQYMNLSFDNLLMIPKTQMINNNKYGIRVKLKDSKDYGIDNLNDLSENELNTCAATLLTGFDGVEGFEIYKSDCAAFIVFDWKVIDYEKRYATIIDGNMIYIYGQDTSEPLNEEEQADLKAVVDSLKY